MTRPNPQAPQGVASTWSRWARALVSRCRRTLLAAWRVGATRPRPGEGMDPAPCPVADAAILTPTASTLSPVSPAAGLHDRPRRPASLASVLHAVSPVAVATVVAGGLLWMTPVLSDGRPHAARLAPAVAATPDAIRYAATLTGDLAEPLAVAVGPTGMVYVADTGNGRIRVFDPLGVPAGTIGRKAAGPPQPGDLVYPVGIAAAPGRLYVADNVTGHISSFTEQGQFAGYVAEDDEGRRPFGIPGALFAKGDLLYLSDLAVHRVLALRPDGTVAATFGAGKGSAPGHLFYPGGIWVDDAGTVYVADANNHRAQVFGPDGALLRSITDPTLNLPRGIAVDAAGRLYLANTLGHTISMVTPAGQVASSYGSSGSGWTELGFPGGVALAGDRLYVADRANHRVQVFLLPLPDR